MGQRINFVTLGVADLDAARRFYVDGLGWPVALEVPGESVFVQAGHGVLLGLFDAEALEADAGNASGSAEGKIPVTLTTVVESEDEVFETMAAAEAAGATVVKTPQLADFGGFHGYFADPAGFRWEISTNAGWSVAANGEVTLHPINR